LHELERDELVAHREKQSRRRVEFTQSVGTDSCAIDVEIKRNHEPKCNADSGAEQAYTPAAQPGSQAQSSGSSALVLCMVARWQLREAVEIDAGPASTGSASGARDPQESGVGPRCACTTGSYHACLFVCSSLLSCCEAVGLCQKTNDVVSICKQSLLSKMRYSRLTVFAFDQTDTLIKCFI
jgi:hypothetical protein